MLQKGLDLGCKNELAAVPEIVERLDAQPIAYAEQTPLLPVPNGVGKHAAELLRTRLPILLEGMQDGLGIAMRPVVMAQRLKLLASYASAGRRSHGKELDVGEGVIGQCAIEKRKILLSNVDGRRFRINTGLTRSQAAEVLVMPVVFGLMCYGLASGLSLYFFMNSLLSMAEQKIIKKIWIEPLKRSTGGLQTGARP